MKLTKYQKIHRIKRKNPEYFRALRLRREERIQNTKELNHAFDMVNKFKEGYL